jgi:hypothetical protein
MGCVALLLMVVGEFGFVLWIRGHVNRRLSRYARPSVRDGLLRDACGVCCHAPFWWLEDEAGVREERMRQIAEFVAVLACGLFAGAAIYVSLVEHPARMECGVEIATAEFLPSYRRGTIMQVTLAAVCLLSSIAAWLAGATFWWIVAGVLQVSVVPFTLIVILPTNNLLLSPTLDRRSVEAERLLARWGALHAVRSVLSGVALLLFLYLAIFRKPL